MHLSFSWCFLYTSVKSRLLNRVQKYVLLPVYTYLHIVKTDALELTFQGGFLYFVRVLLFNRFNTQNFMWARGLTDVLAKIRRKWTGLIRLMSKSAKSQLFHSKLFEPCHWLPRLPMPIHQSVHWAAMKIIINNNAIIDKSRSPSLFPDLHCEKI